MVRIQRWHILLYCALFVCALLVGNALYSPAVAKAQNTFVESNSSSTVYAAPSLYWGSQGDLVKQLQERLHYAGFYTGSIDGIFGPATSQAVRDYQSDRGLTSDGIVGERTANALGISLSSSSSSSNTNEGSTNGYSSDEVYLLARLVYGEARGEPYSGQVAVAAVILTRVRHADFPNSIAGVVYQTGAFDAVKDGQINMAPDETSLRAARDAVNGSDPSGGAVFYYNPKTATNKWIRSRPIIVTIGNHVFCA